MSRRQVYEFEHIVLRDAALLDPILFVWASRLPNAAEKLKRVWSRCAGDDEDVPADGMAVWADVRPSLCTIVVTLPEPEDMTECFFAAALISVPEALVDKINELEPDVPASDRLDRALKVLIGTTDFEERSKWNVPVLFFTLELGMNEEGLARTVLCQWAQEDGQIKHINHGNGPQPTRDAFLAAVGQLLSTSTEPGQA
jgi:hypothetical protein